MDGFINSKIEKQTIYEIYRACRLCGAGAGYKMPIIQNVVSLDGAEVELKQKIRECVQIEVHQDDKMPPLICELCVDKVNDFYEFLEMCRHTNKRTRLRLGLPPQAMPRGAPDAGDCILGVTEPVFLNDDSNEHSLRSKKSNNSGKTKKEDKKNIISNNSKKDIRDVKKEPRSLRSKQPSPPRLRGTKRYQEEEISLSKLQKSTRSSDPAPKSILKKQKEFKADDDSLLTPRLKRPRDREVIVKKEMQNKRVKIQVQPLPSRTTRTSPNTKAKSLPSHKCKICKAEFDNPKSLNNHMRSHTFTKPSVKPTKKENKEIKCTDCRQTFSRKTLLNVHKCPKQGGDCSVCKRHFYSQKSLIRHRSTCVEKKKELVISPRIRRMLRPLQVRVARCDPLFENVSGDHYDVSDVVHDYGLDKTCIYPYLYSGSSHVKFEPGYMVNINDDIRQAFDADKYVHWDSEDTDSDADLSDSVKKVDSLTAISLKTLFSKRCLGKVPKKRRKVKAENAFDSILNVSEFDSELKQGINDIIDSLDKIDEPITKSKIDNDSLFGDENPPAVTNDDFDSLFKNDKTNDVSSANDNDKVVTEGDVYKNEVNESSVSEDSSKDRLELSKELSIDSNEKVDVENAEESQSNKEVVNKMESKSEDIAETKAIDSELDKKLNDGNVSGDNLDNKENTQIIDSNTKNLDITSEGTEIDNESSKPECLIDDKVEKNQESDLSKLEGTELPINTDETNCITDKNVSIDEENCSKTTDTKIEKVNGASEERFSIDDLEDLSDSEMDDNRLMAALDAQIGESETDKSEKEKTLDDKRIDYEPCSVKCADLESISDGEFNLNE